MKRGLFLAIFVTVLTGYLHSQVLRCSKCQPKNRALRLQVTDLRSDTFDIVHTTLELDMTDMQAQQLSAKAFLAVKANQPNVQTVRLDLDGLDIDSVTGAHVSSYFHDGLMLSVSLTQSLSMSLMDTIRIYYHGSPLTDSSGWGGFYFNGSYAWNLGVGFAADPHSYGRIWHPCIDNFIERSTYEFSVRTLGTQRASCNGILTSQLVQQDSTVIWTWKMNQPIPSYLACVAVGPYSTVSGTIEGQNGSIPYMHHVKAADTNKLKSSFIHLPEAVQGFEHAYGAYPFDKVGYSLVPFNSGAMEHATNITYPISAANGSLGSEDLMAHELAHMWWGDNVTCETDGDMWINEGWASFSAYLFQELVYGRPEYELALKEDLRYMLQRGHIEEGGYRAVSGQTHEYVYGDHVYKKGALVAHNLRGYMGDSLFFATISQFMNDYKFQAVSSDTMQRFFSDYSGMDLSSFFNDWVYSPGYNLVVLDSYRVEPIQNGHQVSLFLQQKLKGTPELHSNIPVYYTVLDGQGNAETGKTWMSGQFAEVNVQVSIDPAYLSLYFNEEQAQARTADRISITDVGTLNLQNMYWTVNVNQVTDTAFVSFEHLWSVPDPIKEFSSKPYKMSNYHYWRVSGMGIENMELSGQFFYDGRTMSGNSTYLDVDLVSVSEDSLILLHRTNTSSDWNEYEHYTKNMLGSNVNAFGLIELQKIMPGEYVLANRDHSVLGQQNDQSHGGILIYPNPSHETFTIQLAEWVQLPSDFKVYDVRGTLVRTQNISDRLTTIGINGVPSGVYQYYLSNEIQNISGQVVLEK